MSQRLISLDFFRGFTIAAMIVVNDPGSWSYIFNPLRHSQWNGATPTDLVFPFFLFIVGVSIVLSLSKIKDSNISPYFKILKRTLILFGIGILLEIFPDFDFSNVRIVGVLQRIALVYFFCAFIYLNSNKSQQIWIGVFCLITYWAFMKHVPFEDSMAGILEPGNNFAAWIDRFITPGRLYNETWDPEGFFSTIPSIATGISGMSCGHLILNKSKSLKDKIIVMYLIGSICLSLGLIWDFSFPINKLIWTSSYVLLSSGLAMLFLASCMWIIDHKKSHSYIKFGIVFGSNAISAYILHTMLGGLFKIPLVNGNGIQKTWMEFGFSTNLDPQIFSLIWALFYTFIIYLIVNEMYNRKLFIKL